MNGHRVCSFFIRFGSLIRFVTGMTGHKVTDTNAAMRFISGMQRSTDIVMRFIIGTNGHRLIDIAMILISGMNGNIVTDIDMQLIIVTDSQMINKMVFHWYLIQMVRFTGTVNVFTGMNCHSVTDIGMTAMTFISGMNSRGVGYTPMRNGLSLPP